MKLKNAPFESIKNKNRSVEMRLYDSKRQLVSPNDYIVFKNVETNEELQVKVARAKRFKTFDELYHNYDKTALGYKFFETANPKDMDKCYTKDEQRHFGVVAIELDLDN